MNVISQLPRWAQSPTQKFVDKAKIEGTETSPMDQDGYDKSFQLAAGVVMLASNDEIPGEDQAMGQPGVVKRNGVTIYFEGDSSNAKGQIEVVTTGRRGGIDYATYVHSRPDGFSTLQMVHEDGSIDLNGSQAQHKGGAIQGYLLAGQTSADTRNEP